MAREFAEATAEIARLVCALHAQTERLDAAFRTDPDGDYHYRRFGVELWYDGRRCDLDDMSKAMERRASSPSPWRSSSAGCVRRSHPWATSLRSTS